MATKKAPTSAYSARAVFVECDIPVEDREKFVEYLSDMSDFWAAIEALCGAGYKVTMRHDDHFDCGAAWLVAPDSSADNSGLILSCRATSPAVALWKAVFYHAYCVDGKWPRPASARTRDQDWYDALVAK